MKIEVIVLGKQAKKFERPVMKISRQLTAVLMKRAVFSRKKGIIEIYLASGRQMKALNKKFLKKDRDTNVISLVTPEYFSDSIVGEVYLNPLFIKKNRQDMNLMLIHGVLHILGYDHKRKSDRIKMEKKEEQLLLKLAVGR